LKKEWYQEAGITIHEDALVITPFVFIHDSSFMQITEKNYYFSGHIHPGIFLKGWGKQSLRLPCFYFNKKYAVLPAFGKFTGTFTLEVQKEDAVFALTENSIIQIQ
jgi:metallophosphoesterase superfamily enzyme